MVSNGAFDLSRHAKTVNIHTLDSLLDSRQEPARTGG